MDWEGATICLKKKYLSLPLHSLVYKFVWGSSAWLFINALWGVEFVLWGGEGFGC